MATATEGSVPADQVPGRSWYMLALLFLVYTFSALDRQVVSLVVEPLKAEFHVPDAMIGLLGGLAFSIPFAIASVPIGLMVDRLPRIKVLGAVLAVWSLTTAACAAASSFTALLVARMAVGAAEAGAIPASLSLLSDTFPPRRRGTAIGIFYAAAQVSMLILFVGGAWLLANYSWRAVFLIAGIPGVLLAILVLLTLREPVRGSWDAGGPETQSAPKPTLLRILSDVSASKPICLAILANIVVSGVGAALTLWAISFFVRIHGVEPHQAATIIAMSLGVVALVGALIAGPAIDRFAGGDPVRTALFPAITSFLAAAAGVFMATTHSLAPAVAGYAVLSFFTGATIGPGNLLLLAVTPARMRGSVTSLSKSLSVLIGAGAFSFLAGAVSDAVGGQGGIRVGLLAVVIFLFAATALFFAARLSLRKSKAAT